MWKEDCSLANDSLWMQWREGKLFQERFAILMHNKALPISFEEVKETVNSIIDDTFENTIRIFPRASFCKTDIRIRYAPMASIPYFRGVCGVTIPSMVSGKHEDIVLGSPWLCVPKLASDGSPTMIGIATPIYKAVLSTLSHYCVHRVTVSMGLLGA